MSRVRMVTGRSAVVYGKQLPIKIAGRLSCPRCKKALMIRKGKFGDFLGCDGYPACTYTYPL